MGNGLLGQEGAAYHGSYGLQQVPEIISLDTPAKG